MIRTITLEQYKNYVTENCSYLTEQYIGTGTEITLTLDCDDDYYYLTADVTDYERDIQFCKENGYDTDYVEQTVNDCKEFGCKMCDTLDEINRCVAKMLDERLFFFEDEYGCICS